MAATILAMTDPAHPGTRGSDRLRARRPSRPFSVVAVAVAAVVALVLGAGCSRGSQASSGTGASLAPTTAVSPGTASPGSRTGGPPQEDASSGTTAPAPAPVRPAVAARGQAVPHEITTPDGRTRTYLLYVPSSVPPERPVPLLVAMHGGVGWGSQYEKNSGFDGLAEANAFIVAYPDGIGAGPADNALRTWNGGYCCGPAVKENVDDVAFIAALIDEVEATHSIDTHRVYAAGHSNGGIMAYRLACELSDRIVAVGVQSSSLGVDPCAPSLPVSLIHIHGTADRNHPIDGGVGDQGISGVSFHPAIDGVRAVARADGCPTEPTTVVDQVNADVTVQTWQPCRDATAVQFVVVAGASHAWMGHESSAARLTGTAYQGLDSSLVIWTFLAAHPRP